MKQFPQTKYFLAKLTANTPRYDAEFLDPRHSDLDAYVKQIKDTMNFDSAPIDELCYAFRGKTADTYVDDGYPILKVRNITGRGIDWETEFVEPDFYFANEELHIKPNDILLTSTGDGTIGRVDMSEDDKEAMPDGHVTIIRVKQEQQSRISSTYLSFYLRSSIGQTQMQRLETGSTGQTELSESEVKKIQIVFPRILQTQDQCVVKALNHVKDAKVMEKQVVQEQDKMELLLRSAVKFELTTSRRRFYTFQLTKESERMDVEFNDPFYAEYDELMTHSAFPWVELGKLVTFSDETKNPLESPDEQFLYVDIGNIDTKWGTANPEPLMGYQATSDRMRRLMHEGEVLVSTTRPTRKAIAVIPEELDGEICSTGFAVLRCNEKVTKEYLFYILRTDFVTHQFERFSTGSGYPEINKETDLPRIKIPCPETVEPQIEIVNKVEAFVKNAKNLQEQGANQWREAVATFEDTLTSQPPALS